jgi:AraC-like DNA-binding protein
MGQSASLYHAPAADEQTIAPLQFTTKGLPPRDQFPAWRAFMAGTIELDVRPNGSAGFAAEQSAWNLGSLALSLSELPGGGLRVWHHYAHQPLDHWCLVLVMSNGNGSSAQRLSLRSLARPFVGHAGGAETIISLYIPRDLFPASGALFDRFQEPIPHSPLTALLCEYLVSLCRRLADLPKDAVPGVTEATRELIVACLSPGAERIGIERPVVSEALLARARRIANQQLGAADLTPRHLARALGVSRSELYRLFEHSGGVAHFIKRQRLLAAHRAFADPLETRPIFAVAEGLGFADPSAFSRAFRAEFGYSPTHARAVAPVKALAPIARPSSTASSATSLADFLSLLAP